MIDDGSEIADLMSCFTKKQVQNPKFPVLSSEVHRLKETEGGTNAMCTVMQHYEEIARQQGIQQGMQQGMQQGIQQGIQQGMQQGMQQGRLQERLKNASAMLSDGMSIELVAKYTSLPLEQVRQLAVHS